MVIGIILIAILAFLVGLLVIVCHKLEGDMMRDDQEQMEWLKHERKNKRH